MRKNVYLAFAVVMFAPLSSMAQIPPSAQPSLGNNPTIGIQNHNAVPSDANEFNWKGCERNDDCVIIGRSCFIDAVNEEFERDAERDLEDKNKDTECNSEVDEPDDPIAVCDYSVCKVQY